MGDIDTVDTGEFKAILERRYPNLDQGWLKTWLDELNDSIGWLKERFSGTGHMYIFWRGGTPQEPEWTVKSEKHKDRGRKSTLRKQ
jgi:hypothetical protein